MEKDWKIVKLGDVCEINLGKTPPRDDQSMWDNSKTTKNVWLSISDLNNTQGNEIFDSKEYITDKAAAQINPVKKGTLMMSFKLTLGRCAIAGRELYTNEAIAALPFKCKGINIHFLKYYLEYFDWHNFAAGDEKIKGITLNKKKLSQVEIPLPPIETQRKIVKYLDEKFAKIEAMDERTKELVAEVEELFQSTLNQLFTPPLHSSTWQHKRLGDVGEIVTGKTPPTSHKEYFNGTIPFIKPADINKNGTGVIDYCNESLSEQGSQFSQCVDAESVLMVCIGSIGKVGITARRVSFNQQINAITQIQGAIAKCVYYALCTTNFQSEIIELGKSSQATLPIVNKSKFSNLRITIPPLAEQKAIVEKLDQLHAKAELLESFSQTILADYEDLKQSLLHEVFVNRKLLKTKII